MSGRYWLDALVFNKSSNFSRSIENDGRTSGISCQHCNMMSYLLNFEKFSSTSL